MAIYVPRARRRRNLIIVSVVCAVVGAALGLGLGRSSAPTVEDRVRSVRTEAPGQARSPEFAKRVDGLADRIETAFGGAA